MLGLNQLLQPLYHIGHWLKMTGGFLSIIFPSLLFTSTVATANYNQANDFSLKSDNLYRPFIEVGGAKYFHQSSSAAGIYDLFIPLLQTEDQLFFTDLRIFDRSGKQCEGNAHLGYRKLYPASQRMFGIYGALDRKKTKRDNYFNQLTFGFEYWQNRFFIGGNFYQPIGTNQKPISPYKELSNFKDFPNQEVKISLDLKQKTEKAIGGGDIELGFAFTDSLTGYAGGYCFAAHNVNTIVGPKTRLTYDYIKPNGRIGGVLDGVSVEAGIQYDKVRRTSGYLGIKLKIGLTALDHTSNLPGFARHMVELVRRDQDIIHLDTITPPTTISTEIIATRKITSQDLIEEFGIIDEHNLVKLYIQLTDMVVKNPNYSNDENKILPHVHSYLKVLFDGGAKTSKYIVEKFQNYLKGISNKETRINTEPLLLQFINSNDQNLPEISIKVAIKDHFENLSKMGISSQEKRDIQQKLSSHYQNQPIIYSACHSEIIEKIVKTQTVTLPNNTKNTSSLNNTEDSYSINLTNTTFLNEPNTILPMPEATQRAKRTLEKEPHQTDKDLSAPTSPSPETCTVDGECSTNTTNTTHSPLVEEYIWDNPTPPCKNPDECLEALCTRTTYLWEEPVRDVISWTSYYVVKEAIKTLGGVGCWTWNYAVSAVARTGGSLTEKSIKGEEINRSVVGITTIYSFASDSIIHNKNPFASVALPAVLKIPADYAIGKLNNVTKATKELLIAGAKTAIYYIPMVTAAKYEVKSNVKLYTVHMSSKLAAAYVGTWLETHL